MKTPLEELVPKNVSNKLRKQRQVKAKKIAPLRTSFRHNKSDSTSDKVLRDLLDSVKRTHRISNCLQDRISKEFSDQESQRVIELTNPLFKNLNDSLKFCADLIENKFEDKLHEALQRKLLPIIKSRGYN